MSAAEDAALVATGGFCGAAVRQALNAAWPAPSHGLPGHTLVINLTGALLLGFLVTYLGPAAALPGWARRIRLAVGTGFCGAYTTYSTFVLESVQLGRHGAAGTGATYVVVSVAGGVAAAWAGVRLGRRPATAGGGT